MSEKKQFLAQLAQMAEWINRGVARSVLRDEIAFQEACETLRHLGRLRRRLIYGSTRPIRGDHIYTSDPQKARRDTNRRRKSLGFKPVGGSR